MFQIFYFAFSLTLLCCCNQEQETGGKAITHARQEGEMCLNVPTCLARWEDFIMNANNPRLSTNKDELCSCLNARNVEWLMVRQQGRESW
jgi:hypothetical protein